MITQVGIHICEFCSEENTKRNHDTGNHVLCEKRGQEREELFATITKLTAENAALLKILHDARGLVDHLPDCALNKKDGGCDCGLSSWRASVREFEKAALK